MKSKVLMVVTPLLAARVLWACCPPAGWSASATADASRYRGASTFDAAWRLARDAFVRTEMLRVRERRLAHARRGVEHARRAIAARPQRVEGHYYLALCLAKVAEARGDLRLIKPMIEAAERAAAIDASYDNAGPLVYLGKVYLTAPSWPMSVGNPERAIELLERALSLAPRPLTRVFLGEAYYEDEQYRRAALQLRRALAAGAELAPKWRHEAEAYLRRVEARLGPGAALGWPLRTERGA